MTDQDTEICGCDFIQIVWDEHGRAELHHVIPDDDAGHITEPDCPCNPSFERIEADWVVVDHRDQDTVFDETG